MITEFRKGLEHLINRNSQENNSDTPDFILAEYLTDCLIAFDKSVVARENWYGRTRRQGSKLTLKDVPPPQEANMI